MAIEFEKEYTGGCNVPTYDQWFLLHEPSGCGMTSQIVLAGRIGINQRSVSVHLSRAIPGDMNDA
jgi:hypothetical protein